ncbi:Imm5 family immunity protein [Pedobacter alluvionis]|uniref:Immunity protein Imm5 of predicted polymorphic toxin system n=1 Tax=Pedobacter alluvionis TaxID=475253 RepID=A0A497YGG9_9SPHI|nr:Imm5 family immunity protein [Pedobacter alluvionis]RLJ79470.1 immunity protein Imm5 of predicted polymorphic toxin system [Pedobacter alluvionis]TFB30818.1 hypothetical protein E3V97_09270 [Pedobacter alluvionis]
MNTALQKIKQSAQQEISQDKLGMLEISTRNSIFNLFNDSKKSVFLLLHTLKDYEYMWDEAWPQDKSWSDLFYTILDFVDQNIKKEELEPFLRKQHTYMERRLQEKKYDAAYIGLALVYAGYEIISGNFIIPVIEDEFSLEPEEWSSMFVASLSYNGGAEDLNDLIPEKNRFFWNSFLGNIQDAYDLKGFSPKVVETEKEQVELKRTQPNHILDSEKTRFLINNLDDIYSPIIKENNWVEFKVESYYVNGKHSMIGFYKYAEGSDWEKYDNTKLFLLNNKHKVKDLVKELRISMYDKRPSEGAWYKLELILDLNDTPLLHFYYDTYFQFFEKWTDQLDFYKDFKDFSRDEEYTPLWLKDIIIYNKPV